MHNLLAIQLTLYLSITSRIFTRFGLYLYSKKIKSFFFSSFSSRNLLRVHLLVKEDLVKCFELIGYRFSCCGCSSSRSFSCMYENNRSNLICKNNNIMVLIPHACVLHNLYDYLKFINACEFQDYFGAISYYKKGLEY